MSIKAATVHEIKQELTALPPAKLTELCLRLAKFKKDNKELLTYLLFEASDENNYIQQVKQEIDLGFEDLPKPNIYLTKKTLRKVLRTAIKRIKYTGSPQAEVEVLTYFCLQVRHNRIPLENSPVLSNLYQQQVKKIRSVIATLHEDLQYDYIKGLQEIESR